MEGGVDVVQEKGPGEEVPNAEHDAPEQNGGTGTEEAGRSIPSAQDGALPYRPIPEVDKELGHGRVWLVPVQDADERAPVQELWQMEEAAEDSVGRGTDGDRTGEGSIQDPRLVCGRAVHRRHLGLSAGNGSGGEGGAARAATGTSGSGRRGGGGLARRVLFLSFFPLVCSLSFRSLSVPQFSHSFAIVFSFSFSGQARRGQGELPRAAGGL